MFWVVALSAHVLLSGYRVIATRKIGLDKNDASLDTMVMSFFCVWILGVLYSLVSREQVEIDFSKETTFFIFIGGFLFGISQLLTLKLFRLVAASVAVFLTLLNNIAVVALATVFGAENLTNVQILGIGLMVISIGLAEYVAFKSKKKKKQNVSLAISTSMLITVTLSIIFALAVMNEKHLLQEMPVTSYLIFGWGSQFFAAIVLYILLGGFRSKHLYKRETIKYMVASAVLLAVSGLFFVLLLNHTNSSSVTTVASSLKIIVAMVLSYVVLNERTDPLIKITSTLISSIGLLLLIR